MDDLISRKAAIDAILAVTGNSSVRELYEHVQEHGLSEMWSGGVNAAIDIIIAVPSVQPEKRTEERTETHACDLIDRQAAIDALTRKMVSIPTAGEKDLMGDVNRIRTEDISAIRRLPSAQADSKETSSTHKALDTISRQAVIEINRSYHGQMPNEVNHRIWKEINELPSAQQRWIPCSERLPEDGTWNIFSNGKNISVERYKMDAIDHFFPQGRWFSFDKAIAWMPLPEPYAERRTDGV